MKRKATESPFKVNFSFSTACHRLGNDLPNTIIKNGLTL